MAVTYYNDIDFRSRNSQYRTLINSILIFSIVIRHIVITKSEESYICL